MSGVGQTRGIKLLGIEYMVIYIMFVKYNSRPVAVLCTCIVEDKHHQIELYKRNDEEHILATPHGHGLQRRQRVWMLCAKHSLPSLGTFLHQC